MFIAYTAADEDIVTISEGAILGKNRGITEITAEYGENTVKIMVAVADMNGPRIRLP